MLRNKFQAEVFNLTEQIHSYVTEYHNGAQKISDQEYDDLYFDLFDLQQKTGTVLENSPTIRVRNNHIEKNFAYQDKKVKYINANSLEELKNFCHKYDSITGMIEPVGVNCYLYYLNGDLISVIVEYGNGESKNLINNLALFSLDIPRRIKYQKELIIEGKLTCIYPSFTIPFFQDYKSLENFIDAEIKNNFPFGKTLTFFITDVLKGFDEETNSFNTKLYLARQQGFFLIERSYKLNEVDNSIIDLMIYDGIRRKFFFSSVRFRVDDCAIKEGIIYQYCQNNYQINIKDIVWSFNSLSEDSLVPYIRFNPIFCHNEHLYYRHAIIFPEIKYLNNLFHTETKQLYKNQKAEIYMINFFNPLIKEVDENDISSLTEDQEIFQVPIRCPHCDTLLTPSVDTVGELEIFHLTCSNKNCPGKYGNRIKHYFGKDGLNINGFSEEILNWLIYEKQWLSNGFKSIYQLQRYKKEWYLEPGYNKTIVDNLLQEIENSKKCSFADFLSAMSIPFITKEDAINLSQYFSSYEKYINVIYFDLENEILQQIPGLTDKKINALTNFDYTEFDYLYKCFKNNEEIAFSPYYFDMPLRNQTYVVVGPVKYFDSVEWLCGYIHGIGGAAVSQVTEKVDYVINNDPESNCPENIAARELGIPIITEQEFLGNIY